VIENFFGKKLFVYAFYFFFFESSEFKIEAVPFFFALKELS